ncbi:DUF6868 family protein [Tahibacter caeni]|uniref:DUF6868 family protein n=1 Tax=Tahibacter caeni TaxID=1453545 RepID=UPI002147E2D9|nr:hypothetical protein [Tahibacter caeni]
MARRRAPLIRGTITAAFDAIHYGGMAVYKIGILLFNLAPLLALHLLRGGH